jgi:D-alanyl-lipoteichoic acid acyltransferase DltB (MBOAT superfamily)
MLFSSSVFILLFLTVVLGVYFNPWFRGRTFRNVWLLLASLVFYAWGEPVFVFLMLLSIVANWGISQKMGQGASHRKTLMTLAVIWNIGLLFVFKYLTFTLKSISMLCGAQWNIPVIDLPIGISFFTFQILSYMFDVYYGKVEPQRRCYKFALYVSMFPQLVAGPIVRYSQIADEIDNREENWDDISTGIVRFCWGLGKKVIFSNYMGVLADNAFDLAKNGTVSVVLAWVGAIAYTAQIYYDFSGYSDMAIGLGSIFGFHFQENFNYPYVAKSITDFWRRWHISLSSWFRDYVYIPLGGSRVSAAKVVRNTFLVWLLTGIWHGANWTFLVWGLGYFLLLMVERRLKTTGGIPYIGHLYTLFWVNLLWVVFRADSLPLAVQYIGQMFGAGGRFCDADTLAALQGSGIVLPLAILFSFPVCRFAADRLSVKKETREGVWAVLAVPVFILCVAKCVVSNYNPFIYFNF